MIRAISLVLIILLSSMLIAKEPISKQEVLQVAKNTKEKMDSIQTSQFLLVKKELVNGKDTGYQYLDVKVRVEPLQIYLKYLKPRRYEGREALYQNGEITVRRGGSRLSNMVLHILPSSPLAMEGNRYPITFLDPKAISERFIGQIENELRFEETEITVYRQAKVFNQPGTHYRLIHTEQKEGMQCYVAEVMISKELGVPIYFRSVDFRKRVVEEYAFKDIILNPTFTEDEFDEDNKEYGFNTQSGSEN